MTSSLAAYWIPALVVTELARAQAPGLPSHDPRASEEGQSARGALESHGVQLALVYTAETFGRWGSVEVNPAVVYWGSVDAVLIADSLGVGLWSGGTWIVRVQHGHGHGASRGLELQMPASSLEASPFVQVGELWYEQRLLENRLRMVIGKQDANMDFLTPRFPEDFLNGSFGVPPNVPLPSYPAPAFGALVSAEVARCLSVRAGAFDGRARLGALGLDTAFNRGAALIAIGAVARHSLGQARPDSGIFSVGAWHHTSDVIVGQRVFEQNYGAFALADVMMPLGMRATAVQFFARVAWVPADRNPMDGYLSGGVTLQGMRVNDAVGLGAGHVQALDKPDPSRSDETFLELFYRARFEPWFSVTPDVQVSLREGRATWLAGTRISLNL